MGTSKDLSIFKWAVRGHRTPSPRVKVLGLRGVSQRFRVKGGISRLKVQGFCQKLGALNLISHERPVPQNVLQSMPSQGGSSRGCISGAGVGGLGVTEPLTLNPKTTP